MTSIRKIKRARTCDVAFGFRMGAGFPGDVNRTHPFSVVPGSINTTNPPAKAGDGVLYHTDGTVRSVLSSDTAVTKLDGIAVRSFPTQSHSSSSFGAPSTIGAASLPTSGILDVIEDGFVMVKNNAGTPVKGAAAYIWIAAASGNDVPGQFRASASAGNAVLLTNVRYTGAADANGNVEVQIFRA